MTRGLGGRSPANVIHQPKGIHFPAQKRELVQQAKQDGAEPDLVRVLDAVSDQESASIAEVMKALGEAGSAAER